MRESTLDLILTILMMVATAILVCLVLIVAFNIGVEMQTQHLLAVQNCTEMNSAGKGLCLV